MIRIIIYGSDANRMKQTMRLIVLLTAAATAFAATPPMLMAADLETITVIGSRTERPLKEIAATIDIISARQIEKELARDIADLVRFEPGVTVSGTGSRYGLSGFNIRGVGGNRVLTLVDGVRVADEFSFGPFLSARRDFVDIDSLATAEIARGPISSLWGSDALGGVVAFNTLSPRDLLREKRFYSGYKLGYSSADRSSVGTVTIAGDTGPVSSMVLLTLRNGQETENNANRGTEYGAERTSPDQQDTKARNVTAKLDWNIADNQSLIVTLESFKNEMDTKIFSDYGIYSRGTLINSREAADERDRSRATLRYQINQAFPWLESAALTAYWQESESYQSLIESRSPPPYLFNQSRDRISSFEQTVVGANAQLSSVFSSSNTTHTITYGLDYYETSNESVRDGGTVDAAGNPVREFTPLPTRDFPKTDVENIAFFIQDEIELLDGRLLLSPGARYDRNKATTSPDSLYFSGNPGAAIPIDFDESEVSLKFGAVYQLNSVLSIVGRYSEGFRAPPFDDVNLGFTNVLGGYKTISAPNLTSETSESFELGLRFSGSNVEASLAVFTNDYDDFIASAGSGHCPTSYQQFGCIDPEDGFLVFQSENISQVTIDGAELRFSMKLDSIGVPTLSVRGAIAYAKGEDKDTDEPINTVQPLTGVIGLSYRSNNDVWGGDLIWTGVQAKDASDISGSALYATSGYGILDLMGEFSFNQALSINFGVFNLTDKSYIRWADSPGIGRDAAQRFTQPGVNYSVGIKYEL